MRHHDRFTRETLKELMEEEHPYAVSIYMPGCPAAPSCEADRIRFKNLIRQAEQQLKDSETVGMGNTEKGIAAAYELLEK